MIAMEPTPKQSQTASAWGRGWTVALLLAAIALTFRWPGLADRPMHTDESVNAYILGQVLAGEGYQYDPRDRHGPALYALAWPVARLAGQRDLAHLTETVVRLVPVLLGCLAAALFTFRAGGVGRGAALFAGLLWCVAPLPLYFSRDFIHETGFVTANLGLWLAVAAAMRAGEARPGTTAAASRAFSRKVWGWSVVAGAMAGLMLSFKETAVLNWAAQAAGVLAALWPVRKSDLRRYAGPLAVAVVSGLAVVVVLVTWGGTHWRGPLDLVSSYFGFIKRAKGAGHEKPWHYYLALLANGRSGLIFLGLALAGAVTALASRVRVGRFLTVTALATLLVHSAIRYKQPWLAVNIWVPFALLAGVAVEAVVRRVRGVAGRGAVALLLAGLAALVWADTRRWVYKYPAHERNPYAYSQTGEDVLRLPEVVAGYAKRVPAGRGLHIAVVAADPWPLPWYLRAYPQVGFWQPGQDPGTADIYIAGMDAAEDLVPKVEGRFPEFFGVRPNVLFILWGPPPPPEPSAATEGTAR